MPEHDDSKASYERAYERGQDDGYWLGYRDGGSVARRWTLGDFALAMIACLVAYALGSGMR